MQRRRANSVGHGSLSNPFGESVAPTNALPTTKRSASEGCDVFDQVTTACRVKDQLNGILTLIVIYCTVLYTVAGLEAE